MPAVASEPQAAPFSRLPHLFTTRLVVVTFPARNLQNQWGGESKGPSYVMF